MTLGLASLVAAACVAATGVGADDARMPLAVSARGPVPQVLRDTESSAEDLVDYALARDRRNVVAAAAELESAASGPAAAALTRAGVPAATVARLRARAGHVAVLARRAPYIAVALAANDVSALMAELYAHFRDRVPASVLELDYLDREAQLRSLAGTPTQVAAAVKRLAPVWARLRQKVVAAGGAQEAAAFTAHVAAMKRLDPAAARAVQAEAAHGLELVDRLEQVFLR